MGRIHIDALIQRERDRIIVERRIRARVMDWNGRACEAREELGDPAYASRG